MSFDLQHIRQGLTGISGILITPYDEAGEIAPERLQPILDRALAAGVHLPVINGNTSEFYALTLEEAMLMTRETCAMVGGRAPVVAGIGRGIRDAIRLAENAADAGAGVLMIHQPPDPFVATRGFARYIADVRAASGLPVVLYIRNDTIGVDDIARLCGTEGVVGVKWATPNPMRLGAAMRACDPGIVWVGGLAETWAPTLYAVGARGFTSGLVNVWPERSLAIHAALERGDYAAARALIEGIRVFEDLRSEEFNGTNVTVVKAALNALGHDVGPTRAPSAWPLTPSQEERLRAFLSSADIQSMPVLGERP